MYNQLVTEPRLKPRIPHSQGSSFLVCLQNYTKSMDSITRQISESQSLLLNGVSCCFVLFCFRLIQILNDLKCQVQSLEQRRFWNKGHSITIHCVLFFKQSYVFSLLKASCKWYYPDFMDPETSLHTFSPNIFNIFQNTFNTLRELSSELLLEYVLPLCPEASFIQKKEIKDKKFLV